MPLRSLSRLSVSLTTGLFLAQLIFSCPSSVYGQRGGARGSGFARGMMRGGGGGGARMSAGRGAMGGGARMSGGPRAAGGPRISGGGARMSGGGRMSSGMVRGGPGAGRGGAYGGAGRYPGGGRPGNGKRPGGGRYRRPSSGIGFYGPTIGFYYGGGYGYGYDRYRDYASPYYGNYPGYVRYGLSYGYAPARTTVGVLPQAQPAQSLPSSIIPTVPAAARYQVQAERALRENRLVDAVRLSHHAVVEDEQNGKLRLFAAQALFAAGRYADAANELRVATSQLEPEDWGFVIQNYKQFYRGRNFVDQMEELVEFIKLNPDAAYAYTLRGFQYRYLGYDDAARKQLTMAAELDPNDDLAGILLADLMGPVPPPEDPLPPPQQDEIPLPPENDPAEIENVPEREAQPEPPMEDAQPQEVNPQPQIELDPPLTNAAILGDSQDEDELPVESEETENTPLVEELPVLNGAE